MTKVISENDSHHNDIYLKIKLERFVSFCIGFLLITITPYEYGFFPGATIHLLGSYGLNLFEMLAIPTVYFGFIYYITKDGIYVKKYEKLLFLSIILLVLSRIISLLAAEILQAEQFISIFLYVEALTLIYIFANLFTKTKNRSSFIFGIIIGVFFETIGGLYLYIITHDKAVFFSNSTYVLQVFLILVCILVFANKKYRFWMAISTLVLVLAVFATLTRTALIFLPMVLVFGLMHVRKKEMLRSILFFVGQVVIVSLLIVMIMPSLSNVVIGRIDAGLHLGSSISYRLYLWDKAIATFLQHPLTGIGSGGFSRQLYSLPQIFGWNVEISPTYEGYQFSANNRVLDILSETGLIGFIPYILWVIGVMGICKKVMRFSNLKDDIYAISVSSIVMALIIMDFYGKGSFTPISNAFIGFILGWYREKTKL